MQSKLVPKNTGQPQSRLGGVHNDRTKPPAQAIMPTVQSNVAPPAELAEAVKGTP